MWNQWPIAAVPAASIAAPPPQPSVPPPLPDAPPPPPPAENAPNAGTAAAAALSGAGTAAAAYMGAGGVQSGTNPYEQYTAAQYAAMTPEQQYALQQHWQQWQTYQQEYAKWHAQYGEQYKREMAAAAAATTPAPTVVPAAVAAPVAAAAVAAAPVIGPVYPQAQLVPQLAMQQPQAQTYFPQAQLQPPPPQMQAPPPQIQTRPQSQLPGKIMAQPQMYNQPPPPPPQGYQQHSHQQQQMQQPPLQNQWQQQPPPGRFNQVPPVGYNQPPNRGDTGMFPNLLQPPPSFMQQPPPASSGNQMDAPWSKGQPNKGNNNNNNNNNTNTSNDRGNMNEGEQRSRWDGSSQDVGGRQNRWQYNDQGNNNNNNNNNNNKSGPNQNQFGNRRSWPNNAPGNNNNNRGNPFNNAQSGQYGSDEGNFGGDTSNTGNFGRQNTFGDGPGGNYASNANMGNFGPGQGTVDNFGNNYNRRGGNMNNNNNNGRWEHNRQNQGDDGYGPAHNSNEGGYNRGQNQHNYNQQQQQQQQQQQRQPELDEASFDRLFDQWEKQFEDWKRANANHPDHDEYRRYEEEFEKQRRRIAERREQMRRRRQMSNPQQPQQEQQQQQSSPHKPQQQLPGARFDNYEEEGARYDQQHRGRAPSDDRASRPLSGSPKQVEEREASPVHFEEEEERYYPTQQQQQQPLDKKDQQMSANTLQTSKTTPQKQQPPKPKSVTPSPKKQGKTQPQEVAKKEVQTATATVLGKRKNESSVNVVSTSTPAKQTRQENILIISLDDDDDDELPADEGSDKQDGAVDTPMKNIFKKSDGIPGLDLVADEAAAAKPMEDSNTDSNKKIPSLFDVLITKPGVSPTEAAAAAAADVTSEKASSKPDTLASEPISDTVSNALKDPDFMNNLSQALAQAQGRDRGQQQPSNERADFGSNNDDNGNNDERRPLSFAEWQRKRNQPSRPGSVGDDGSAGSFGQGNESGNRFGPDQRQQHGFGPNGPPFGPGGGPSGAQLMGPNFIDFSGPSNEHFGPNRPQGGPNFNRDGPADRRGPGLGNGQRFGPGPNGPFGRNFGPGGQNYPNFNGPGPHPNERGQNFGPNFRGNGPGPFRPNFCDQDSPGPMPDFGGSGPFGRGPGTCPDIPYDDIPNDQNFAANIYACNYGPGRKQNYMPDFMNDSFNDNPFRRNGGPSAPNFDDGPGFGGQRGKGQQNQSKNFGQQRNMFGNGGNNDNHNNNHNNNNNKPRTDGVEHTGNSHPNEPVYRPMQVFDYQNSRNTAAKVIDYGHKSADIGLAGGVGSALQDFRPVNTFDYGHASHGSQAVAPVNPGPGAGPHLNRNANTNAFNNNNKKKNKKKNKNRQRLAQQQPQTSMAATEINAAQRPIDAAPQSGKPDDLEDISDGEDNLADVRQDNDSPPPSPPKMNRPQQRQQQQQQQRKAFPANPQRRMLGEPPAALFPSTAAANQQIPEQTDARRLEMSVPTNENRNTISIDEVLLQPGRLTRPNRICIILRGPPGSGKSYVARLVKDKELEMGGANPRILSIDDYFIIENDYEEKCPKTGKKIPKKELLYEYDDAMEETYMQYLIKSFKKTLSDNLYDFIIVDCNNNSLRTLNEFYCNAKDSNFVPYIIDLQCDVETCLGRNSHQRSESDIRAVLDNWCATPLHYIKLDVSSLLENVVEMEDVENMATDDNANSEEAAPEKALTDGEDSNSADAANDCGFLKSKWENDTTEENLARLDGTKRLMQKRKAASMADYLQLDDWEPPTGGAAGKKRVRWADIEEKRAQQKMRAIGFVVGQTDWKRMMDPNAGNRALNKTKYIERVNKRR